MKAILILSDGMRPDAVENHPVIRRLRERGACCMAARTVMPSVTLPCHMSLFHSVEPSRHGVTTNTYSPQVRPISGLFEQLSAAKKNCAMFFDWEQLRDLGRPGSLSLSSFTSGSVYGYENTCRVNTDLAKAAMRDGKTDFIFLYLGWPDEAGHHGGWLQEEYMTALDQCCGMVGELLDTMDDDWALFYTADHGGHDRTHGTELKEDMTIPIFCVGKPFAPGKEIDGLSILDIAPTIADLMGADIPDEWEGHIIR